MLYGAIAAVGFTIKLDLLQARIRGHACLAICLSQFKHCQIERVKSRQGDELELVAHQTQLLLKLCDGVFGQLLPDSVPKFRTRSYPHKGHKPGPERWPDPILLSPRRNLRRSVLRSGKD